MALSYFLMYLGFLFTGSALLWMLIKQFAAAFAAQGIKPMIYGIVIAVLSAGTMFGTTYATNDLFLSFWIFVTVFIIAGIVQLVLMHSRFYKTKEDNFTKLFIGELIFSVAVVLF